MPDTYTADYNAFGMSPDGSTVYGEVYVAEGRRLFRWRPALGEVTILPVASAYGTTSAGAYSAMAADYSGNQIIGYLADEQGSLISGLWIDGVLHHFPVLPGDSPLVTYPGGVSRNGRYLGGAYGGWGCIWKDNIPTEFVDYVAGVGGATFTGVADHGRLAIGGYNSTIWSKEHGLLRAPDFFTMHGATVPSGIIIHSLRSVSSDGSVFAGTARGDSIGTRGFVAYTNYKPCYADFNNDGGVDGSDIESFFITWQSGVEEGDVNNDGGVDGSDIETFFSHWERGGCG